MVRRPLLIAVLCAALAAVVYVVAIRVPVAREADLRTLEGFMGLWTVPGASYADAFVSLFDRLPFALLAVALVACAVVAGRAREGAAAFAAMLGAGVTTQLLKPLLATQRDFPLGHYMAPEAWPSGHTTAVMSFALALAIVAPPRLRPLAAASGALLTVGTVYSILILGSHYPSDVIGGFLVATAWACVAVIPLRPEARPSLRRPGRGSGAGRRGARGGGRRRGHAAAGGRGRLRGGEHDVRGRSAGDRRRRARAHR